MAQILKLEAEVQLKTPAEKFYNLLKSQNDHIPKVSSDKIHSVQVLEGDWETAGSVKLWKGTVDGNVEVFKERVEVDEANKTINSVAVGGNVLDLYSSYKLIIKVASKSEGALLKISIEYEKLNEDAPAPNKYLQYVTNIVKDIDAHLVN